MTHAQSCRLICGYSVLGDVLLSKDSKGKPMDPHADLAAMVLGIGYEEFDKKIRKHKDTRQACKPPDFGYPAGMGDYKLVIQQRQQGPDTPCPNGPSLVDDGDGNLVPGFRGLRFCILMDGAETCGARKRTTWGWNNKTIKPSCEQCLDCAKRLKDFWKRKWPENVPYFAYVQSCVEYGQVITAEALERWPHLQEVFYAGQQLAPGEIMQHVSGRIRNVSTSTKESPFCSAANGFFQGMLSDVTKHAHRICVRECYDATIRVPDMLFPNSLRSEFAGGPSPLYGSRIPAFFHDELLGEHPESVAHEAATRISEVMRDCLRWYCPDVADAAEAEPTLIGRWDKRAEKVVHRGRLVPWTPDHNPKKCAECQAA